MYLVLKIENREWNKRAKIWGGRFVQQQVCFINLGVNKLSIKGQRLTTLGVVDYRVSILAIYSYCSQSGHKQYESKWAWLCPNKILLMNTDLWIWHNFSCDFSQLFKNKKQCLAHRPYQNRQWARQDPCTVYANPYIKWLPSTMLGRTVSWHSSTFHGSLDLSAEYLDLHIPLSHTLKIG